MSSINPPAADDDLVGVSLKVGLLLLAQLDRHDVGGRVAKRVDEGPKLVGEHAGAREQIAHPDPLPDADALSDALGEAEADAGGADELSSAGGADDDASSPPAANPPASPPSSPPSPSLPPSPPSASPPSYNGAPTITSA